MKRFFTVRRLAIPLAVLLVAFTLNWWDGHRKAKEQADIHAFMTGLCGSIAAGRDLTGTINPSDSFTEQRLIEQLERACGGSGSPVAAIQFIVSRGDFEHAGSIRDPATHTVIIRRGMVDELGVRLVYEDRPSTTRIVGFWLPQP